MSATPIPFTCYPYATFQLGLAGEENYRRLDVYRSHAQDDPYTANWTIKAEHADQKPIIHGFGENRKACMTTFYSMTAALCESARHKA